MCKDTKIETIATILLSVTQQRQLWNDAAINRSPLAPLAIHQKLDFSPGQTLVSSFLSHQMTTICFLSVLVGNRAKVLAKFRRPGSGGC